MIRSFYKILTSNQWLVIVVCLTVCQHTNVFCVDLATNPYEESLAFQGISEDKQVDTLFYANEARGLLPYYKKVGSSTDVVSQLHEVSKKLSLEINPKNRSKRLLHVMRVLNFFHDEKTEVRFAIIEHLNLKQLYDLVFLWRQAIYTSSFNGVFDKMKLLISESSDQAEFFSILKSNNFEGFNAFVQACSSYNRLNELFSFFDSTQLVKVMSSFAEKMDQTKNYYYAMAWVEIMLQTTDTNLLSYMQDYLLKKCNQSSFDEDVYEHDFSVAMYEDREQFYERLSPHRNLTDKEYYGLMMGAYQNFDSIRKLKLTESFLKKTKKWTQENQKYLPRSYSKAQLSELRSENRDSIQRHFFYGDSDGWATWVAFLRKHKRLDSDQVITNKNYVKIIRSGEDFESNVVIYANKPGKRILGQEQIDGEMSADQSVSNIFVHRGHSYHLHRGLDKITNHTKLAILGSCGGYNDLHSVLKRSLDVQVVISKGKGTYWVNRAILDVVNTDVANGFDVDWSSFRQKVIHILKNQHHIKDRYQDMIHIFNEYYVLPNENVGLSMLNHAIHLLNDNHIDDLASLQK